MRTIKELTTIEGKVYVHFSSDELCRQFLHKAGSEGLTFGNLPPTQTHTTDLIALSGNELCYVGSYGRTALQCNTVTCVDYEKYINGCKNFMFKYDLSGQRPSFGTEKRV